MAFILKNKKTIPDINQDEKNEYIDFLIKSGKPMMLKCISGDNVIFIHELSINRETRIKFTATIPWDNNC